MCARINTPLKTWGEDGVGEETYSKCYACYLIHYQKVHRYFGDGQNRTERKRTEQGHHNNRTFLNSSVWHKSVVKSA